MLHFNNDVANLSKHISAYEHGILRQGTEILVLESLWFVVRVVFATICVESKRGGQNFILKDISYCLDCDNANKLMFSR